MTSDSDQQFVGITRINGNLRNLLSIAQAKVRPGLAAVSGFVDAVANRQIGPMQPLTTADINRVRIRQRNRNRADGPGRLLVEDRRPRAAVVVRLPNPAIYHAYIEDIRLARHSRSRLGPPAPIGPNPAPVQRLEEGRVRCLSKTQGS